MRKLGSLAAVVLAMLVIAPAAEGAWYMAYGQAVNAARGAARELCNERAECYRSGAECRRVNRQRFSCEGWNVDADIYGDITCAWIEYIGVGYGGYIRNHYVPGSMDCY